MKILTLLFFLAATLLQAGCSTAPTPKTDTLKSPPTPDPGFQLGRVTKAVQQRYGNDGVTATKDWSEALALFRKAPEQSRLKDINDYVNHKIRLDTDIHIWGQEDYWATPIEALTEGAGDCEDYAIAKYFSLKFAGVPVSKLRISYVKARIGGANSNVTQAHVVLTHYSTPDADPLVLDSLISEIRPASRRTDLIPIFSFNSEGVWPAGNKESQPGAGNRLSKWMDLLEKMEEEGFE